LEVYEGWRTLSLGSFGEKWMVDEGIDVMEWPAYYPDLKLNRKPLGNIRS